MDTISIQTSQNIAIEQTVASIGERLIAALIDYSFFVAYAIIISIFGGIAQSKTFMMVMFIPLGLYHLICELAMNGQSFGKQIMKIRVVKIDGAEPGFMNYFLRWIFRLIDVVLLFGSISTITIILNGKGQRFGDMAADTTVIRIKNSNVSDTLFTKLPDEYQLVMPEVEKLDENDIATAKEVLDHLKKSRRSMEAMALADKARKALQKKMGVEQRLRSENFLFTIIRDYNYIQSRP